MKERSRRSAARYFEALPSLVPLPGEVAGHGVSSYVEVPAEPSVVIEVGIPRVVYAFRQHRAIEVRITVEHELGIRRVEGRGRPAVAGHLDGPSSTVDELQHRRVVVGEAPTSGDRGEGAPDEVDGGRNVLVVRVFPHDVHQHALRWTRRADTNTRSASHGDAVEVVLRRRAAGDQHDLRARPQCDAWER